jgi:hypothetical protein
MTSSYRDLLFGTYVAHRYFRNGDEDGDDRAQRRCPRCGGVQYDWGGGFSRRRRRPYFINWYCNGIGACGLMSTERMSTRRFYQLRQHPTKTKRAPGAPWKRWRQLRARLPERKTP